MIDIETIEEIIEKAKYCLNCKNVPCKKACPMQTNIPSFIEKIKLGQFERAYNILMENNIFSPICSTICPQENQCEGSCTRGIKSKPVEIGKLEYWINQYAKRNLVEYCPKMEEKNSHRVAIIGSGPASLSCAYELAKQGIQITIFEKEEQLGGILRYGIPGYRLNKEDLEKTISKILDLEIKVKTNCELGKNIHIQDLKEQGYEAIFVGIGAGNAITYQLCDESLKNIYNSDWFLKQYNQGNVINNLGETVIIGGGNVAIDCARSAVRIGATKVSILYRRNIDNMPARKIEIEEAIRDQIEIIPCTKVIKANGENGKISEIECIKTEVIDGKAVDLENTNFNMKVDTLIFAIGLSPEKQLLEKEGFVLNNGLIEIDDNGKTNLDKVYAGGDLTQSKSTVCRAIASGKSAAKSIINEIIYKTTTQFK